MSASFPKVDLAKSAWVNLLERDGSVRSKTLAALIREFIDGEDVLVEVNRKLGDMVSRQDAVAYVERHVGCSDIRIADRAFLGYVLMGVNGVATGGHCGKPEPAVSEQAPESCPGILPSPGS